MVCRKRKEKRKEIKRTRVSERIKRLVKMASFRRVKDDTSRTGKALVGMHTIHHSTYLLYKGGMHTMHHDKFIFVQILA